VDIVERVEHNILHKSFICIRIGLKRINTALFSDYPGSEKGIVATVSSYVNEYITRRKSVLNIKGYFFFLISGLSELFVKAQVHIGRFVKLHSKILKLHDAFSTFNLPP